jgi:hypothetical protein
MPDTTYDNSLRTQAVYPAHPGLTTTKEIAQPAYEITAADRKRQENIVKAWLAYDDIFDLPLKKMPGQADDNVITNRIQAIVERICDFLFGQELEITVEEGAPPEAQELIDRTWGRKEARIPLLQKWEMSGSMSGEGFLRLVKNRDGSFRIVVLDPCNVFVKTDPQDCETILIYCIEYSCMEMRNGKPAQIFYREEITRVDPQNDDPDSQDMMLDADTTWSVQHWLRVGERGNWIAAGEPYTWPYPFAPIFPNQNLPRPHDFWGVPDITCGLIRLNDSLNFVQSNINRIIKIYGQPIIYASGTGLQELDIAPGKIIEMSTADGKIVAVNITSDIPSAQTFATNLRSDIDEQSGVPAVATGRVAELPQGNISGIAIKLLYMPLLLKIEKKRCLYGKPIIDICKALFRLSGLDENIEVTLHWQDPLPVDDAAISQSALTKSKLGVSKRTLITELGYDADEEAELNKQEDKEALAQGQGMLPVPNADQSQQPSASTVDAQSATDGSSPSTVRGQE